VKTVSCKDKTKGSEKRAKNTALYTLVKASKATNKKMRSRTEKELAGMEFGCRQSV
jgi:hypothetical protein